MLRLTKRLIGKFSIQDEIKKRFPQFLEVNTGAVLREKPTQKQRKYKNVEITEDFKKIDDKRKKQRYEHMKRRQFLLEQQLKNQKDLLSGPQLSSIQSQITSIQENVKNLSKEIAELTEIIDSSEPDYMVAEGPMKLIISNHIIYLKYLNEHNTGYTLHPETIRALENVHYCLNHNLPISRINLYEIMPEYFEAEIGELEESVKKLIHEKQIFIEDEDATSSIRFFHRIKENSRTRLDQIPQQVEQTFDNMYDYSFDILNKHGDLLREAAKGNTPFRNIEHMITVMQSDLPIKYLPEEEALRKDIIEVVSLVKQFEAYRKNMNEQFIRIRHSYIDPPPYIKNHPVLLQLYNKSMEKWQNPVKLQQTEFAVTGDQKEVILFANIEKEIRRVVAEKYDPAFVQAMNKDRSLIDKKKIQIDFYNMSTAVMENLQALQDKSNEDKQIFQALPKSKPGLLSPRKKNLVELDHLTRAIFLNNKDKVKYNLEFFSQWFGVDMQELKTVFEHISYLRIPKLVDETHISEVNAEVLKFNL